MKTQATKTLLFLFTILLLTSCNIGMFNGVKGDGNVVTENRKLNDDFTAIKASAGVNVYLIQGDKNEVIVEADENLQEIIKTEISNGTLKIYNDKNIWNATSDKVYVTFKNLDQLAATSGSDIVSENEITSKNFSVSATSGADIKVEVKSENVSTNATSGASIKISGTTDNHTAKATSGADIKAYNLISKNVSAGATSGADIDVYASEKITASATSAADIDYKGNPKITNNSSTSAGSVSKR